MMLEEGAFDNAGDEFLKAFRDALDAAVESYGEADITSLR